MTDEAVFPRNFLKAYPRAVRGDGCFIYTAEGQRYLDASGGAAVVIIGHGVAEVASAMAAQAARLAYVHSSQFQTAVAEKLAERILALAPREMHKNGRVYFTSGGSEATETALKLARQYWIERGQPKRFRILSRLQSYHGSTLGALSVSGNVRRREPFAPMLSEWGHIPPCYCYRCPFGLKYPECNVDCADELDRALTRDGSKDVAAFIFEPVVGATLGAVSPPEGYVQRIAEICHRHGILLIADEIMSGMGRTGKPFAVEHWGVSPDLILVGKESTAATRRSAPSSPPEMSSTRCPTAPELSSTALPTIRIPSRPLPATPSSTSSSAKNYLPASNPPVPSSARPSNR